MPSSSGRITNTTKTTKTTKSTGKKTTKAATKTVAPRTTKTTKSTTKTTVKKPSTVERVVSLEEKVDKLLSILDTEFSSELRQGPRGVSNKIRKAGLIK
tara:strand:+ start:3966 stop:4262 length:297 start_codon:yes stop_codon:yes gene_type:complete